MRSRSSIYQTSRMLDHHCHHDSPPALTAMMRLSFSRVTFLLGAMLLFLSTAASFQAPCRSSASSGPASALIAMLLFLSTAASFQAPCRSSASSGPASALIATSVVAPKTLSSLSSTVLFQQNDSDEYYSIGLSDSDQGVLGSVGTVASLIMLYSEYTLKQTGCGLPAGPFGLLGFAEGVSYLTVLGIVGFSAFTKFKSGRGLPPGPNGLLGAAEGLGFVAVTVGVVVLAFQILDYQYIPNAVPMEGGMCN
jgi:hypothetical protein